MAMKVFLLAPILDCVSEIVCGEMSEAVCRSVGRAENEGESCHVVQRAQSNKGWLRVGELHHSPAGLKSRLMPDLPLP